MLWIKNHRLLTLSLLSVFVCSLCCLFGFSSDSYAISQSFTCTRSDFSSCNREFNSSVLGFTPAYVSFDIIGSNKISTSVNIGTYWFADTSSNNYWLPFNASGDNSGLIPIPAGRYQPSHYTSWGFTSTTTLTLTFYDSWPIVPCECPDCPEIPDNPYDDKLDNIYKAILIGSATMIFIYFMFCVYQCFFGGLKK